MQLEIVLHSRQQAWAAIQAQAFPFLKTVMQAGGRWVLSIKRMKRTGQQNRRYWGRGVLAQIAEQATVNGRQFSAESWHELFKRRFIGVIELPDGSVRGMSSTALTTSQFCDFSDAVEAYAASELGVTFYDLPERPPAANSEKFQQREAA